jgi:acetolactate synthase-1/3 small subunit
MTTEGGNNGRAPAPAVGPAPAHHAPPARALPGGGETRRHTLIAIVLDKPGVLNRVSSLMRARNFNIDSLAVSRTDRDGLSRMTISLHGDDVAVEQATKQLYRLIDVLKVQDVTAERTVEHELALVKVRVSEANRADVLKLIELTRGRVLDVSTDAVIAEVSGSEAEVDNFVACVREFGIKELVRTGAVVMARGSSSIEEAVKR